MADTTSEMARPAEQEAAKTEHEKKQAMMAAEIRALWATLRIERGQSIWLNCNYQSRTRVASTPLPPV